MGLFGELDVASVSEDILNTPDGTYPAVLTKVTASKSQSKKDERGQAQLGVTFTYTITDPDSPQNKMKVTQYQTVPQPNGEEMTADEMRNAAYLKRLMTNLGVPEDRVNDVEPSDLIGAEVYITTKKNGDYINVVSVKLQSEVDATDVNFS